MSVALEATVAEALVIALQQEVSDELEANGQTQEWSLRLMRLIAARRTAEALRKQAGSWETPRQGWR